MSNEQQPPKRGPGRPPKITVAPRSDEATWSQDDVLAARLSGSNPFGNRSDNSVPLRDTGQLMHQRWFNTLNNSAQLYRARHDLGWVPITVADLPEGTSAESLGYTVGTDGTIRRGPRDAEEVLFKMPEAANHAIQMKKTAKNLEGMTSETKAREAAAAAAVGPHGEQAADYLQKHGRITIKDSQQPLG